MNRGNSARKEIIMANNNTNTTTQVQALAWLIENAPANTPADVMEKAQALYTSKTKKYDRPKTESVATRKNRALIEPVVAFVAEHPEDKFNSTFISMFMNHPEIRTPQKARVIADLAIKEGLLEKVTEKRNVYYKVA